MTSSFVSLPRAAALSIAIIAFASPVATAQTPSPQPGTRTQEQTVLMSTPAFANLVQGKTVKVTKSDGTWQEGVVKSISTTSMVVAGDGFSASVPFDQVVKVEKASYRIRKGTLIGLGAGAGVGLVSWLSQPYPEEGDGFFLFALSTGIGVGAGAIIGAVMHASRGDRDVIYNASRQTKTLTLSPILSRTHKGVAFSMTWR